MLPYTHMRLLRLAALGILFAMPLLASAQLVPCMGPECQACHLVSLGQNIINWLIGISAVVGALLFAWAGFKMVIAGGNASEIAKARGVFTNVIVGLIIMLAAWLVVDTVLKILTNQNLSRLGGWNSIECVDLPVYGTGMRLVEPDFTNPYADRSRGTASGLAASSLSDAELAALVASGASYDSILCSAASSAGIGGECASLKALMRIESSGCVNKVSPAGAYGCMQILPATARNYDPALANASDTYIANLLMNDDAYNLRLGVQIYQDAYNRYNGDRNLIYAAYNGGFGANERSADCPGMLRWQCEWDNREHTVPNTGYEETRNYVRNINNLRGQLE
jgi:hypothetical protein